MVAVNGVKVGRIMRALFYGGLKDNPHLSYGFLTGILRVAKKSIFSGLQGQSIGGKLLDYVIREMGKWVN